MDRRDYLGECNDQNVSLPDFKAMFCDRCYQPECSRSKFGTSAFDKRVSTWEQRLFLNVPRMDKSDPRFLPIAGSSFKMYQPEVPSVSEAKRSSAWLDPRDLPEAGQDQEVVSVSSPTPQASNSVLRSPSPVVEASPLPPPMPVETPTIPSTPAPPAGVRNLPHNLLLMNTQPTKTVLPGAPSAPKADPWAAPVPAEGDNPPPAPVVKKGAKIKFGGGGVE